MKPTLKKPVIGAIVKITDQGLGLMAKAFYDNGLISMVLVEPCAIRANHFEWYPGALTHEPQNIDAFIAPLDVLLIFEKPDDWAVVQKARQRGVRIVLMPMYEITPEHLPVEPDLYLCPSMIDLDRYRDKPAAKLVTVPVEVPWNLRKRARVFIHNCGTSWGFFRNGTIDLLTALPMIESPIKLIVRMQEPVSASSFSGHRRVGERQKAMELVAAATRDERLELRIGTEPWEQLWTEGDVFVFPEIYNGLSLPLQEAHACGMLVMASDRYPMNTWLPREPLIPVSEYRWGADFGIPVKHAIVKPEQIAASIDHWYDADIEAYSLRGQEWALENSWQQLSHFYLEILGSE